MADALTPERRRHLRLQLFGWWEKLPVYRSHYPIEIGEVSALLDAVEERDRLRKRVAELEAALQLSAPDLSKAAGAIKGSGNPKLDALLARAMTAFEALTPEQQAEHRRAQAESFARGQMED